MKQHTDMGTIVRSVKSNVGKRVRVMENKGRNKVDVAEGVISETYPCVFTVKVVVDEENIKTLSYSYTDVFTKDVELVFAS